MPIICFAEVLHPKRRVGEEDTYATVNLAKNQTTCQINIHYITC